MADFAIAQSTVIVYNENFNSGTGSWVIGGFRPSWKHGIPSLPNIASNGSACFATGDAGAAIAEPFAGCLPVAAPTSNGNYYNCCERSFVESPVIDLTGVTSPLLSLDINVHCEQTFDGAKVQISLNGGTSWQDIGAYNSSTYLVFPDSINCREQNWYNKNNISYLTSTSGGCGNVNYSFGGGNSGWSGGCAQSGNGACGSNDIHGTNGWVTASLCIPQAANQPSFKMRIAFGSGSQVYSDGIAFDNVKISDVYPVVNFSGNQAPDCEPVYQFNNTTDCGQTWEWNFGHPASPGNTSADANPVHQFPAAGTYIVTLVATDFCGGSKTFSKPVIVAAGNSPVLASVIPSPTLLCDSTSGSISINLTSAGTPPYTISYFYKNSLVSISGLTGNPIVLTGMTPGIYNAFTITDANACEHSLPGGVEVIYTRDNLSVTAFGDTLLKAGESTGLDVIASIPSTFTWSPAGTIDDPFSATPVVTPIETTTYTVTATDTNGCSLFAYVTVFVDDSEPCTGYFFPNSFTPNGDGKNEEYICFIDPLMKLDHFKMTIFDRWGRNVFISDEPGQAWPGKGFATGIYIVVADFKCRNKKTSRYSGIVNLIR